MGAINKWHDETSAVNAQIQNSEDHTQDHSWFHGESNDPLPDTYSDGVRDIYLKSPDSVKVANGTSPIGGFQTLGWRPPHLSNPV